MSESKMVTEREAVMRERAAFVRGSQFEDEAWREMLRVNHSSGADCIDASRKRYPLPKVERPRVVVETSVHGRTVAWKYEHGALWWRNPRGSGEWYSLMSPRTSEMFITPERVKLLADLLANPTELVEDTP